MRRFPPVYIHIYPDSKSAFTQSLVSRTALLELHFVTQLRNGFINYLCSSMSIEALTLIVDVYVSCIASAATKL